MIRDQIDTMVKQITDGLELPETGTLILPLAKENAAITWFGTPVIMLTEGLVNKCPPWQTQAIIAHELAHLLLGHPWQIGALKVLLAGVGVVGVLAHAWVALAVCVPLMVLAYALYCRACELAADALAARVIGTPMPMIAWLETRAVNGFSLEHPSPRRRIERLLLCELHCSPAT